MASFGIETNLIETNFVNLAILGGGIFNLGGDFLAKSLETRTEEIVNTLQAAGKKSLVVKRLQMRQEKLLYKLAMIETLLEVIVEEGTKTVRTKIESQYSKTLRSLLATVDNSIGNSLLKSTAKVVGSLWSKSVFAYSYYLLLPIMNSKR
jgi:hypothetical protein